MQTALEKKPNLRQQECIDTLKGSIMVLAGPGTGKTYTLIERIKNMLAQKITPSKILCLTFSDAAANEMKKRLVSDIGPLGAEVNVYTYHSFCNEIINNYPDDFVDLIGARIISDATKRAFLRQCIDEIDPKALRTENYNAYYYIPEIIKAIEEIKKNLISKDKFFSNLNNHPDWKKGLILMKEELEEKLNAGKQRTVTLERKISELELKIEKSIEIWKIYERYCELMQENNLIDFSDMINSVLKKFQLFPAFASKIANEFEYFLVDEYQDTNKAQNLIIFHLVQASNEKNIFVVGDDDQIIYGFQGAQIDNVEKFLREFPKTKVICLNENMRSTQSILDYSYEIIKKDTRRLEINPEFTQYKINKKLVAKNLDVMRKDRRIKFNQFEELEQEQNYITNEIENLIKSNDCPIDKFGNKDLSQIAILTKTNSELYAFGEKLKAKNIPYELKEGKNIFEIKSSIMLILYMKLIVNPVINSDKLFTLLLNKPFNINPKDYEKLLIQRQLHKNDFFIDDIKEIEPEKFEDIQLLENITQTYDYLKKYSNCENLKNTVLEIVNKTGILKYFLSSDINRFENIMGIKKIIEEAQGLTDLQADVTLENFVEYLTIAAENNINIPTEKSPIMQNAVQLLTYHASKGREFEHVYLPTLEIYKWERDSRSSGSLYVPYEKILSKEEKEEIKASEKIKLLFVAVTRAKHTLTLSYPLKVNGKNRKLTKFVPFDKDFFEYKEFEYDSESFLADKIAALIKYDFDYQKQFESYITSKISNLKLSATAINTYKICPKQFFYSKIMEFEVKDSNKDNMSYGNSVHKACQKLVNYAIKNERYPKKEEFIEYFKTDFATREISTRKMRADLYERAMTNLPRFYVQLTNTPTKNLYCAEYKINDCEVHGIQITGYIDRIEKLEDGTFALYDYKTGKSKTKEIEDGKKYEDYLNQLRLYKFVFEKISGKTVSKTGFIFPDDCEKNCEKPLGIEDNKIIEEILIETNKNIKALKFEANTTDKQTCITCPYKDICNL